jgi:hypothetical protein
MSSIVFYSYNMSKNFLLVYSIFAHPNGSPAFHSDASSNVVSYSIQYQVFGICIPNELFQLGLNLSLNLM